MRGRRPTVCRLCQAPALLVQYKQNHAQWPKQRLLHVLMVHNILTWPLLQPQPPLCPLSPSYALPSHFQTHSHCYCCCCYCCCCLSCWKETFCLSLGPPSLLLFPCWVLCPCHDAWLWPSQQTWTCLLFFVSCQVSCVIACAPLTQISFAPLRLIFCAPSSGNACYHVYDLYCLSWNPSWTCCHAYWTIFLLCLTCCTCQLACCFDAYLQICPFCRSCATTRCNYQDHDPLG